MDSNTFNVDVHAPARLSFPSFRINPEKANAITNDGVSAVEQRCFSLIIVFKSLTFNS